jgi:hypothetical protein
MTWRMDGQNSPRKQQQAPQRVELQIDALVLHGFPQSDRYKIARAVESELARLISENGIPSAFRQNAELRTLDGNDVTLPSGSRSDILGARVAREVYGRMKR